MPRKPRIECPGYHHVINRGVNRENIFLCAEDKQEFLKILNLAREAYQLTIHSFCILDNHYHLLAETHRPNLSLFVRYLNSQYAIYFNKKMDRVGPLWQGRFKSWYVQHDEYLYLLFRYIEMNPVKVGLSAQIGEYPFSATYLIEHSPQSALLTSSLLHKRDIHDWLFPLTEENISELAGFQQTKYEQKDDAFIQKTPIPLQDYFFSVAGLNGRNYAVYAAFMDGYRQSVIARHLNISPVAVSRIVSSEHVKQELFNKIRDKGLFWSYAPDIQYAADKSTLLIETALKYADLDDIKTVVDAFGIRRVRKVWEVCLKNDSRFTRLNYFLARVFFHLDVEAIDFAETKNTRGDTLRLLAGSYQAGP